MQAHVPATSTSKSSILKKPSSDQGHATLAGKVLQVFRVGGDHERSVGRHGKPAAVPAERLSGPVQSQVITDGNGPVVARTIADSAPVASPASALSEANLRKPDDPPTPAAPPVNVEPIRLQTFSIDLADRLARTRAAQQDVLRELDKFDESGEDLGNTVNRQR